MGEAETDPEAPRISPFKFIPRPKLQGENAKTAQEDVQKIIDEARDKINEAPAPIQVRLWEFRLRIFMRIYLTDA